MFKVWKNTDNINPRISKTNNNKTMLLWKCTVCSSKKLRFINIQEASGILSGLGLQTQLGKKSLFGDTFFNTIPSNSFVI